jgi:hypothetical protein
LGRFGRAGELPNKESEGRDCIVALSSADLMLCIMKQALGCDLLTIIRLSRRRLRNRIGLLLILTAGPYLSRFFWALS